MNIDDMDQTLKDMKTPEVGSLRHEQSIKLTILSARKSAAAGLWLILVPAFFLFSVCMKYYFKQNWHIIDTFEEMMSDLDRSSGTHFLSPLLFVGFPLLSIVLNALSLLHLQVDRLKRELIVTVKLRWVNLILLLVSAIIVSIFFLYSVTESVRHPV